MSVENTVADIAKLAEPKPITRENVDRLLDSGQLEVRQPRSNWWSIRRNGATKRWKKDTSRIYVPFKYGFKFYGNITEADFGYGLNALSPLYFRVKPAPGIESPTRPGTLVGYTTYGSEIRAWPKPTTEK